MLNKFVYIVLSSVRSAPAPEFSRPGAGSLPTKVVLNRILTNNHASN